MLRFTTIVLLLFLAACSGGGGGSSGAAPAPPPPPTDPDDDPITLNVVDSQPARSQSMTSPAHRHVTYSHLGHSDLTVSLTNDCNAETSITLRRAAFDLSSPDFDQVLQHQSLCSLTQNANYSMTMDGSRPNDADFTANLTFSTGADDPRTLTVTDQATMTPDIINDLFSEYVEGALLAELDVSAGVAALILDTIIEISEANWDHLTNPEALYSVIAERITYVSVDPAGQPVLLSGLVARPDVAGLASFVPRDRVLVLTHATGSTPGDLSTADAWFILASQFAARGYLVLAPDNYGRGETAANAETYLMATRTAVNAADLLNQVLAAPAFDSVFDGSEVTLIGYSQGGHSAIGLWLTLERTDISVREVYAGGAPHNLYQTFRGVMQHLDGSCNDGAYCRYVDSDTTLPFATDRILPGFLGYTETGLSLDDIIAGDGINPDFVTDFLAAAPHYDLLKLQLQLSSFTDIVNPEAVFGSSMATLHLYHSDFDRLVPSANTIELANRLSAHVSVDFHDERCNGAGYNFIFDVTEAVGVLHTLCGLSVLDDAMADLR